MALERARWLGGALLWAALLGAGLVNPSRAGDTGQPEAAAAEVVPLGAAPPRQTGWPPVDLGTVTLPSDPTTRVRSPAASIESADVGGVRITTRSAWPVWAEKGYLPTRMNCEDRVERA